ncbi:MAG TPA: dynamin family protein [Tabrizicola sp.]|nr:dynamin family protein [Tabrizicola sp.]
MNKCTAEKIANDEAGPMVAQRSLGHYLGGSTSSTDTGVIRLDAHLASIRSLLTRLETMVVPDHLAAATALLREAESFRTQVALIGQVKAGKTMLTNAVTGMPGMLPSDVNPWTSVVTSIHINTPKPRGTTAIFSFYTAEDWAGLTQSGGRLGELAGRADFTAELAEMRRQVTEMKQRTEARLGANFSLLLGSQHRFNGFSTQILEKYVCLGEEQAEGTPGGRYADVTKSAELYIDQAGIGLPMTISDTPGVNDPFLARERATLATLSQSDICVVVLSAHQAFSSVDLGLMRILLALQSEQVVLFVNRIDELERPDEQIREIDGFIRGILTSKGIRGNLPIVYGSALWAEHALTDTEADMPAPARHKLAALAEARLQRARREGSDGKLLLGQPPYSLDKIRDLSGLHELKALLAHKSTTKVGAPFAADLLAEGINLANQSVLLLSQIIDGEMPLKADLDMSAMIDGLADLRQRLDDDCASLSDNIAERMLLPMSAAFRTFIDEGSDQLRALLDAGGRVADWTPDTERLRERLNDAFHRLIAQATAEVGAIYARAGAAVEATYSEILANQSQLFAVRAPRAVEPKPPASLMRTMTIDMKTSWIGAWLLKATGSGPLVRRFSETVVAEMVDFLADMRDVQVVTFVSQSRAVLNDFLTGHLETLQQLALLDGPQRGS